MIGIDWIHLRAVFAENLATALPWVGGIAIVLTAAYLSPLGRAWLRNMRMRREDAELTEALYAEVARIRDALDVMTARLQAGEHETHRLRDQLLQATLGSARVAPPLPAETRIPTPV